MVDKNAERNADDKKGHDGDRKVDRRWARVVDMNVDRRKGESDGQGMGTGRRARVVDGLQTGRKASIVDWNVERKNGLGCKHGRWTGRLARVVDRNADRKKG